MGDISRNFSYAEFKVSKTYPQVAAAITLKELDKCKMFWMVHLLLQPLRDAIEHPIIVSSGIRRGELNGLVGGVDNSDHLYRYFSCAVDIIIGSYETKLTRKYLDVVYRVCRRQKAYVKQLIYYYPYQVDGAWHGNFLHLSLRDKTDRVWERLYCVSREGRRYFRSRQEAEEYLRNESG